MPLPHKVQTSQPHIASKTLANLCSLISHLVFHPYSATCSFPQACGLSASVALHLLFPAHSFSYPSRHSLYTASSRKSSGLGQSPLSGLAQLWCFPLHDIGYSLHISPCQAEGSLRAEPRFFCVLLPPAQSQAQISPLLWVLLETPYSFILTL